MSPLTGPCEAETMNARLAGLIAVLAAAPLHPRGDLPLVM